MQSRAERVLLSHIVDMTGCKCLFVRQFDENEIILAEGFTNAPAARRLAFIQEYTGFSLEELQKIEENTNFPPLFYVNGSSTDSLKPITFESVDAILRSEKDKTKIKVVEVDQGTRGPRVAFCSHDASEWEAIQRVYAADFKSRHGVEHGLASTTIPIISIPIISQLPK